MDPSHAKSLAMRYMDFYIAGLEKVDTWEAGDATT